MKHKSRHRKYMKKALKLAAKGLFTTGANPRVGCVLVKGDQIVAQAFHQRVGEPHAEALALQQAGEQAAGATAYVTLEPCSHQGRNPPCADALIQAGIKRVVVCNDDPNPLVAGGGYDKLQAAGIEVIKGVLAKRGQASNRGFFHRMQTGLPWVRCKLAQSIDGRTAMASGESFWITGEPARADGQYWRGRSGAIITGIETVLQDDCRLDFRPEDLRKKHRKWLIDQPNQPLRVVVDSQMRLPLTAKILQPPGQVMLVVAQEDCDKVKQFKQLGVDVQVMPAIDGRVDLSQLLAHLGHLEINEVLVEAGATLAGAMLQQQLLDELLIYTAPVLMGSSGRPLLKLNIEEMADRHHIQVISTTSLGLDWRTQALIKHK
ncbi:bifunctional diaminohydroxyphosphoribosylaminopyrimidine deaminase/5-amino-6-(5-phosphoribosylamino)uracil reductase RibD [Marinicella meishanensis]|uniref:bifunctional diaminohydroxyphosphoribosylaminopyrimidine deaminase/5-amino-6-(5-phosphoribosylamino)uracil reductase RibD n=1 Tax=Marinicella meishanensis TaxID=2873263 RepID=UPI001CC15DE5|nr:bifunctional diaminohydroxyphosphoribosylaminopyrimidine deaminase/5-amino-6-(5-phosphoribosylamino)uracil reductase RibD [Marinicella sp. NBU2979]